MLQTRDQRLELPIAEWLVARMSSYKVLPPYCDLGGPGGLGGPGDLGGPDYYSPLLMDHDITYTASTDDFSQVQHTSLNIFVSF